MQSKQEIKSLLEGAGAAPNKRLGQHFLIDMNLMRLLVESAHINCNDTVLEVGCGTGSMTEELVKFAGRVVAVEYDKVLAKIARKKLKDAENVVIINSDVLACKSSFCEEVIEALREAYDEFGGRLVLVSNLPYNVGSAVMANLITSDLGPMVCDSMYVTVQREVADRMVASAGSEHYGTLSILMEATGKAKIFRKLGNEVFWPRPQVSSAMVSYVRHKKKVEQIHSMECFKEVVSLFMGHRRKMLKACVKFADGELGKVHNWGEVFARAFVEPHHRGEELGAVDFISIANLCYEQLRSL